MQRAPYRPGHLRIGVLSLSVDADGELTVLQADQYIEVVDAVLENCDGERISYGDGILTVHGRLGDVSYGLRDHDDIRETWLGVRSDVSDDDE